MASTPWWACRKSGVEIITASVTFASYISSLLRNGRGFAPTTFSIPATPSSRRRFQMSETATISKLRSLPTLPNAGRRAWRKRSENPTIPTRTRSFAPRIFAYRAAGSAAAVAAATFTNSRRGIFVLCSDISPPGSRMGATAGGVEPGQRAAHIGERLFHPRQRVIDVDFVLQVDVAPVPAGFELLEDRGDGNRTLADDALTPLGRQIAQILDVHVEQPWARVRDRPYDVGAGADGVPDVDAQSHPAIQIAHVLQGVVRGREVLVLGPVVVERDADVVLLGEALNAREQRRGGVRRDERHAGGPRVREVFLHVRIAVLVERDHSTAHDLQTRALDVASGRGQLFRRQLVRQVHGLEIAEGCAERLHHLDRLVAGKFSERVAGDAEPQGPPPLTPSRFASGGTHRGRGLEDSSCQARQASSEERPAWHATV